MSIEKLLIQILPNVDKDLIASAAQELAGNASPKAENETHAALRAQIASLQEELETHRNEINRLNRVIVNQRSGYENASPAALGVLAERARQQRMEGYGDVHDDEHADFELSRAAAAYLLDGIDRARGGEGFSKPPQMWPWDHQDWKRKPVFRQFEIAAALVIAEQERIRRNGLDWL